MARRLSVLLVMAAALAAASLVLPVRGSAATIATSAKHGKHGKHACRALRPRKLRFRRSTGHSVATLRWRAPKRSRKHRAMVTARHKRSGTRPRKLRYRVLRNHEVVGQTRKRKIRVRVALDRTYRFRIVPVGHAGKQHRRCGRSKRVHVRYRPPGAPRYPAVSGGESELHVTWQPGVRGDGDVAGYRLLHDGKTVGQAARTSWDVAAAPNRKYNFAVVAVDRRGHVSDRSATVTIVTGHQAPTPPTGLRAMSVSESSIGVQWRPSAVKSGRIVAYRVLRDGAVVRQVRTTSMVLDNLAPATDYGVTVVAIDNYGYMSAPATAQARTQDPVPTTGHAHAYLLASTDQSFADFRAHYRQIGVVHPTYYDCTGAARLEGTDDPLVTHWAQARAVKVLPRINCQRSAVVDRILTDPATRAQWLDQLVGLVRDVGYDGVSIDFEAGPAEDRAAMTSFIAEVARRLHADGKLLAMAVSAKTHDDPNHPRSGIFDYPKLAPSADYLFLMAWGLHWSTSTPGPQDEVGWVKQIVAYVSTLPQSQVQKFIYGTNLYALDWPNGGGPENTATAYEYLDIVPRLPGLGSHIQLDADTDNYHATYTDADGVSRDVWYPDAVTTSRRLRIAKDAGLGGVGFWRLGREDQRTWDDPLIAPGVGW